MIASLWHRIAGIDRTRLDAIAASAIAVALELELRDQTTNRLATVAAATLFAAPVAVRRRWPLGAVVAASLVAVIQAPLGGHLTAANGIILPALLLGYGAGAWLGLPRGLAAIAIGSSAFAMLTLTTPDPDSASAAVGGGVLAAVLWVGPWLLGRLAREPSRRADAFRELAEQTAAEVETRRLAAVAEEQALIGRELQDIIAHSVSAMTVQAGGARQLLRTDPERTREAILSVEGAGRDALGDLRRLLGVLRHDDDPRALAPQPGVAELPGLVEAIRARGLECRLVRTGAPELTPGVDLVAYRVVEAALEAACDAGCRTARVRLEASQDRLGLEISGDGPVSGLDGRLAGVAHRAALYDGRLEVVANDESGFRIAAGLPIAGLVTA